MIHDELAEAEGDLTAEVELRRWEISEREHGWRLDLALAQLLPEFSRSYLQQLIQSGAVTRSGPAAVKASSRMCAGDVGHIELRPTPQSQAFRPEPLALDLVYRDDHLMVLNKPAGVVVHPAPGNWTGTLLNGILYADPQAAQLPRAGIVHRLDKDTSGLMVVARSRPAMDALVRLIAERHVSRRYLALAHRPWTGPATLEIERPIGRDPKNRLRMAVVDLERHAGKSAKTTVRLVANAPEGCLLECTLHTGRTHQIRVHLASLGHPLLADPVYGGAAGATMTRQALHAYRLDFEHPMTGLALSFRAPLPDDFARAVSLWGLSYNVAVDG